MLDAQTEGLMIANDAMVKALWPDIRGTDLWTVLRKSSGETQPVRISEYENVDDDEEGFVLGAEVSMEAVVISFGQWSAICQLCREYVSDDAEDEKYSAECVGTTDLIVLPNRSCVLPDGSEVSSTNEVQGHIFRSDSDTWGSMAGVKAQTLYLFWIRETEQFGVVRCDYWCL